MCGAGPPLRIAGERPVVRQIRTIQDSGVFSRRYLVLEIECSFPSSILFDFAACGQVCTNYPAVWVEVCPVVRPIDHIDVILDGEGVRQEWLTVVEERRDGSVVSK